MKEFDTSRLDKAREAISAQPDAVEALVAEVKARAKRALSDYEEEMLLELREKPGLVTPTSLDPFRIRSLHDVLDCIDKIAALNERLKD